MRINSRGKYTRGKRNYPFAVGRCDYTGFIVKYTDLVKQYEYAGDGIYDTGYLVHKDFVDQPNPQNLVPILKLDPVPVLNARPDDLVGVPQLQTFEVEIFDEDEYIFSKKDFSNAVFIFYGVLTKDVTIIIPATFNIFQTINKTTGPYKLKLMMVNNFLQVFELERDKIQFFNCNAEQLLLLRTEDGVTE